MHILAPNQRYEVANYENATIPTNILVKDETREAFGGFYDALFEEVRARHEGAVVTEYAWQAMFCDPCPVPALSASELDVLGADVIDGGSDFVLTRLHYRYEADELDEDLVFRTAEPIVGGRGEPNRKGEMEEQLAAREGGLNSFQGRYVILHEWEGPLECEEPQRGWWGGPPAGHDSPDAIAARGGPSLAPVRTDPVALGSLVAEDLAALLPGALRTGGVVRADPVQAEEEGGGTEEPTAESSDESDSGCGGCATTGQSTLPGIGIALAVVLWLRRRR